MNTKNRIISVSTMLLMAMTFGFASAASAEPHQHSHGHDCEMASAIDLNAPSKTVLADTNDFAVYRIVLVQRGLLDVTPDPGLEDAWGMELLNASCAVIPGLYNDTSLVTGKRATITVPHKDGEARVWTLDPGVYFVRIRPNPARAFQKELTFHTRFVAHYGHEIATAELVKPYLSLDSMFGFAVELLYPEDRAVFQITTTEEGQIHAWTTGPFEPADKPLLELYLTDGSAAQQQKNDSDGTGMMTDLLPPGTYYLAVRPKKPDKLGRVTLNVEFH